MKTQNKIQWNSTIVETFTLKFTLKEEMKGGKK